MSPTTLGRAPRALAAAALLAAATVLCLAGTAGRAAAQDTDPDSTRGQEPVATLPDGSRRVEGRVVLALDSASRPVPGAWVTLHRVGSDRSGPLDSTRTDGRGAFTFRYRPTGTADAIYFVSTTYAGIAYFTTPLRLPDVRGEGGEITVFDTTSAPVHITVRGRHAVVSAAEADGARTVLEVFELSNDTSVTAVAPPGGRGTWSVPLPAVARDVQLRQGEVAPDAVTTTGGHVTLLAPFGPGLKQVAFSYRVPAKSFPLALAIDRPTSVLEVLVEDPAGTATGGRLTAVRPVTLEGRSFRRFLAQDVPEGTAVDIDVPARDADGVPSALVVPAVTVGVGVLMLGALAVSSRRRTAAVPVVDAPAAAPPPEPEVPPLDEEASRLAREIAALDDARAAGNGASDDGYLARRAELKRQLAAALAATGARR